MKTHSGFWFRWAWPVIGCALASLTALAQAGGRDADEWFESDLGAVQSVRALQINYADQDAEFAGKPVGSDHAYRLFASRDGKTWKLIVDKSENRTDVPHDYVELARPVEARFVRLENVHIPTGRFALSGLRVFGTGTAGVRRPWSTSRCCAAIRSGGTRGSSGRRWMRLPGT